MDLRRSSDIDAPAKETDLSPGVAAAVAPGAAAAVAAAASASATRRRPAIFMASLSSQLSPQPISIAFRYGSTGSASLNFIKYSMSLFAALPSRSTLRFILVAREWKLSTPSHTIWPRPEAQLYFSCGSVNSTTNSALMSAHGRVSSILPAIAFAVSSSLSGSHLLHNASFCAPSSTA